MGFSVTFLGKGKGPITTSWLVSFFERAKVLATVGCLAGTLST